MPADAASFITLDCVDSTNNYAMALIHSGKANNEMACFALDQFEGKGRRGKLWESQKGQNIILSIIADTSFLPIHRQFYLSAAVAMGCFDFFNSYAKNYTKLKWPNDLFWNDRKAGGILIENIIKGDIWQWAVIGLGININQTSFSIEDDKRISLKKITGVTYNVIDMARQLHETVLKRFYELKNNNLASLLAQYNSRLYKLNERIKLKKKNIVFDTVITGVSEQGELITFDVMEKKYNFGEVSWVL